MRPIYVYVVLIAIGIPWWWPKDDVTLILGMPGWVISAIVVSVIASIYSAFLLGRTWPQETQQ